MNRFGLLSTVFPLFVLAVFDLLPTLAVLGTFFTTRRGKSLTITSTFESFIQCVTVLLLLWIVYFGVPSISQALVEIGIPLPGLTTFILHLTQIIHVFTETP